MYPNRVKKFKTVTRLGILATVFSVSCMWADSEYLTDTYYKEYGQLVVVTRNSPTMYYENNLGENAGFEHDLAKEFARDMGVKIRFVVANSIEDVLKLIQEKKAHFAAAGLTPTPERQKVMDFSAPYMHVSEQIVCNTQSRIKKIKDLKGHQIVVSSASSYEERLKDLKKKWDFIDWKVSDEDSTELLLEKVWDGEVDCTMADSVIVSLNRRHFPNLQVALTLPKKVSLAWALPKGQKRLKKDLSAWFKKIKKAKKLQALKDRYFGYIPEFDYYDNRVFTRRLKEVFPKYKELFKKAAAETGLDWKLLAVMAYQESHWNPKAKSPTGVRGMMMLTLTTAKEMGVKNRLSPEESIQGGSRYIKKIMKRIPSYISDEDRIWMALAAYNIGWSHLKDARKLAIDLGRNPNRWQDLKTVLPYLSRSKYYRKLEHGYARGYEPVVYVHRIQNYLALMNEVEK